MTAPVWIPTQHDAFLAERAQRKEWVLYKGCVGRCPRCGKPNPTGVTRHCKACREFRASEPTEVPRGPFIPTVHGRHPDEDGVTRYAMDGGILELRADASPRWVPV